MFSLLNFLAAFCAVGLALAVFVREGKSVARNAFLLGMVAQSLACVFAALSGRATDLDGFVQWQRQKLVASALLPGSWLLFSITYARGDSAEIVRRWRWALALAFLVPCGLATAFATGSDQGLRVMPDALVWLRLGNAGLLFVILLIIGHVLALMNLERTLRAAVGIMRWRVKFVVIGLGIILGMRIYTNSQILLFSSVSVVLDGWNAAALVVGSVLMLRSLRRGNFLSVDLYPSAGVIHGSLTVLIAGIYLLLVGALAEVVTRVGGATALPLKNFIILLGLVSATVLLLSERVRQIVRRLASRHFRRPRHDCAKIWRSFTERIDPVPHREEFCRAVVRLVSDTLGVLSVTVWLADEVIHRFRLGGSTSLSEAEASEVAKRCELGISLERALVGCPAPVNIDRSREEWAEAVRNVAPRVFERAGDRLCVPLVARGGLLGIMVVGDRVGAGQYTAEEVDLLKIIGDHVAVNLLNQKLSETLIEAKQMEAFQTMSAFFVHDLKNTASTLSLLLQNLPQHFNDPAFREDALRAVSQSVVRIGDLIRRLSLLRSSDESNAGTPTDLNGVVESALAEIAAGRQVPLVKNLRPLAPVRINAEQMNRVVVNLVTNAMEATADHGEIRVETELSGGWVALTVADTGCGMSREFMKDSLFRPFRSTKKQGMGIGLFQCKRIVESHGGRIEINSEQGKGTTARMLLPAAAI